MLNGPPWDEATRDERLALNPYDAPVRPAHVTVAVASLDMLEDALRELRYSNSTPIADMKFNKALTLLNKLRGSS